MKIKIINSAKQLNEESVAGFSDDFVVVVIDVLRATSTIITALYSGAVSVIPVSTVEEANTIKNELHLDDSILAGEENSLKIPGFDLGNSPLEYEKKIVKGKILILKTTNGTQALRKCYNLMQDRVIYVASFINAIFAAQKLKIIDKDILIICSGNNGNYSLEDFACAGLIMDLINNYEADDWTKSAKYFFNGFNKDYYRILTESSHGKDLIEKGYTQDLKFCSEVGIYNIIPEYKEGAIYLF